MHPILIKTGDRLSSGYIDLCTLQVTREHMIARLIDHRTACIQVCETRLTTVIDEWTKILDNLDQVDTFVLDFGEKKLGHSLKANCLAMELGKHNKMDRCFSVFQTPENLFIYYEISGKQLPQRIVVNSVK